MTASANPQSAISDQPPPVSDQPSLRFLQTPDSRLQTPQIAVLMLHPDCNMACTFCVTENTLDTMTQADAEAALGTIHACGIRNVVFGGGEPFAWPGNLLALAQHAKARGFTVQAGTNGINLPEDYAALDCIDRYVLPLDAAHAPLHNALRRYRNRHHQLITERLAVLKHAGKSVTISTVVTARNAAHLPELGAWLRAYYADGGQLHAWHLYKFIPQGRGGRPNAPQLHLDPKTYHHHCDHTRTHPFPFPVYKRPDMFRSRTVSFFWREQGRLWTSTPTHHSSLLTPNS